jgi:hypothetical protein
MFFSLPFKREAQKSSSQFSPELLSTSATQTHFDRRAAQRSRILSCAYKSLSLKLRIWYRCSLLVIIIKMSILCILKIPMSKSSKKPYNKLNFLIAKKRKDLRMKFKIIDSIERLAKPEIGIYCLDSFPFTNYEFYLYIANCAKKFFSFISFM